ncbi:MAG: hypothetical protein WDA25_10020, partial [Paracoccaceae bacterium]
RLGGNYDTRGTGGHPRPTRALIAPSAASDSRAGRAVEPGLIKPCNWHPGADGGPTMATPEAD